MQNFISKGDGVISLKCRRKKRSGLNRLVHAGRLIKYLNSVLILTVNFPKLFFWEITTYIYSHNHTTSKRTVLKKYFYFLFYRKLLQTSNQETFENYRFSQRWRTHSHMVIIKIILCVAIAVDSTEGALTLLYSLTNKPRREVLTSWVS